MKLPLFLTFRNKLTVWSRRWWSAPLTTSAASNPTRPNVPGTGRRTVSNTRWSTWASERTSESAGPDMPTDGFSPSSCRGQRSNRVTSCTMSCCFTHAKKETCVLQVCHPNKGNMASLEGRGAPRSTPPPQLCQHGPRPVPAGQGQSLHQSSRVGMKDLHTGKTAKEAVISL